MGAGAGLNGDCLATELKYRQGNVMLSKGLVMLCRGMT